MNTRRPRESPASAHTQKSDTDKTHEPGKRGFILLMVGNDGSTMSAQGMMLTPQK